jgi:outer membrane protein
MKKTIIGLSVITCVNIFAMDINQAVDIAIENNYSLKQKKYVLDESKLNLDLAYTRYKPKVDFSYNYNSRDKIIGTQIKNDSTGGATISYNLFNGFMDKYNIDANENLFESSQFTYEAAKQDLILSVKNKYINYLLKQKNSKTFTEALKLYKKQYEDSSNFLKQGLITQNELLEVEVQMLQAMQNLQNAQSEERISKYELENVLGNKISTTVKSITLNENVQFDKKNIENRSELKSLKLVVSNYLNIAKSKEGGYFPIIDASFSVNKYGEDAIPTNRTNYPNAQSIGTINLNWNLYNGNKDNITVMINRKKANQYMMQLKDLKQQINLQYQNAKEQLKVSKLNLKTSRKALETSKLNYEIVLSKVKKGLSSNKVLLDANYLLTQSKQNYFSAYYGRYLAIATLQRILEEKN